MKLFGTKRNGSRLAANRKPAQTYGTATAVADPAPAKKGFPFKGLSIALAVVLVLEVLYFVCVYSSNPFITKWRNIYITTAMDTLNHKWLATAIIPPDVIDEVMEMRKQSLAEQEGKESNWGDTSSEEAQRPVVEIPVINAADLTEEQQKTAFFKLFHELDVSTMEAYVEKNPQVLDNGWDEIYINEAGMDDKGTDIYTVQGEQVLAIDAKNKLLLVRIDGSSYMGVLAIAKDPAMLTLRPSSQLGVTGETAGVIAQNNNGLLAITASGFIDPGGNGNGGILAGYAMCDGEVYGNGHMGWGYKRLEISEDNLMFIKDVNSPVGEDTTEAVEFQPALIIDGEIVVDANCGYTGLHPRTCIGQSDKYEILMLVIEGRMPTRSIGTDVIKCAEILKSHGCMQAMNLDGGTSAMMWYDGEYVTKCCNANLPSGRPLPTAFVYARSEE